MRFIMKSGKNLNDLLNENKAQILRYLIHHRGCSRTELSEAVGLKPASITKIVQQLLEDNLVVETGLSEGAKGRRSISLSFNYSDFYVIAIKISWERLKIDLLDFAGISRNELISLTIEHLTYHSMDALISLIAEKVAEICRRHPHIIAVGVATVGPYVCNEGSILFSEPRADEKTAYPLLKKLQEKISLPVFADQDAAAGALGYWWFRTSCNPHTRLMHIFAAEGVGGNFVLNGHPLSDFLSHAFEFGHIIINLHGEQCSNGCIGCLETYCSFPSFIRRTRERLSHFPDSLLQAKKDTFTIYDIISAMKAKDPLALAMVEDWGHSLGCGIASILPLFFPDVVVVSDIMTSCGDVLLDAIQSSLRHYKHGCYEEPKLIFTNPQDDLVLLGAATVAIDKVVSNPSRYLSPPKSADQE